MKKFIPKIAASKIVFSEFVTITKDTIVFEDQLNYDYFVLNAKNDAVVILPSFDQENFLLTKEYRHPTKKYLLSCPGGFLEKGENPQEGAKRELLEETGFSATDFQIIGSSYPYPGLSSQKIIFVLAKNIYETHPIHLEPSELIITEKLSYKEIKSKIKNSENIDGILCSALFFYNLNQSNSNS